ncbi:MAG: hypothetical protein ABR508_09085 [Candidatus Baltobacteraceae bacterium]
MNRSMFLASSTSLFALAQAKASAQAVPGGTHDVERAADFDKSAFARAADRGLVRMVWEQVAFHPQVLANIKNAFNGLQFGFGHAPSQIAMAMANHGASSAYAYSEYLWRKYRIGEALKLKNAAGNAVTSNVYVKAPRAPELGANPDDENGFYQDTSIEALQARGLLMLTCHTAVEEQARAFVKGGFAPAGMTAGAVAADILTHLIPGAVVVPSMVATIAELQQLYRYGFISPAFA